MLQLIKIFWDICRLKAGPQYLPKGRYFLVAVILSGIIVDSFSSSIFLPGLSGVELIKIIAIYNISLLLAVYLLLKLVGFSARANQTIIAISGAGLLISLVLLPGLLMLDSAAEQVKSFALFILLDNIWRIAVNAHIFRHALSVSLLMAMILSVSYLLFGVLLADILVPAQSH